MNQGLIGGLGQKSSYDISVGDVGQLVALSGEASDVPTESFPGLLSIVFEIPWVPRMRICALEVPHEDLFQVYPILDSVGRKVFKPCSCRIDQEQWKVADNEIIIICSTGLASKPIILEPQSGVRFPRVFWDVGWWSVSWREGSVEDVSGEGLRAQQTRA